LQITCFLGSAITVLNIANLPVGIDTEEKNALRSALCLYSLYKGQTYQEAQGSAIDSGLAPKVDFSIVSTADGNQHAICRLAIKLNPSYLSDATLPLWEFAEPMGAADIPAAFLA
jgi:hypothetical protein